MHSGPEDISRAVDRLRAGGLVAFPTETVYGLGADALDPASVEAVFAAKGRPAQNPLIVHVSDEAMARGLCESWPPAAAMLASKHWPGPLTLVLRRSGRVPPIVTSGGDTVAVRCPSHPLTLALIEAFGGPLVGPSANRSGAVSPTTADHVRDSFTADEVLVLDGGPCLGGIESTVLDLTSDPPRVLRPGLLTAEALSESLGAPVQGPGAEPEPVAGAPARSPGQVGPHYSPSARATLVSRDDLASAIGAATGRVVVVAVAPCDVPPPHACIEMPAEPTAYAARLYAALREADAQSPSGILIARPWGPDEPEGLWASIADRLLRACAAADRG